MNKQHGIAMTAEAIAAYLADHPHFFEDHDGLLQSMELGLEGGGTVSLVERQMTLLRERNTATRARLDEVLKAATRNNEIFDKCRRLVLELIRREDPVQFFAALESSFTQDFGCTAYSLIAFDEEPRQINHFTSVVPESSAAQYVGALMRASEPTLGILRPSEQDFLFRHSSGKVSSAAVLAVRSDHLIALLAIGSDDPHYFKPALGTLFVGFLADVLAVLLPRQLQHS
ncbi:MAG: DUF484 family protein [Proteobacteria bacterium]|jgi:uncharacterized protein YigA (DUF484 family)|nr:DUF484 family protein [Pseudomonadota bacterium]MDA1299749.1 DUF484 family protein [Pseudomonadota bacterium]